MIFSYIHRMTTSSSRTLRVFWNTLRIFCISVFNDPVSRTLVNGKILNLPLSHQLPIYISAHPEYDKLIGRISSWLRKDYESITFIDVGANVGDSIAHFRPSPNDLIIAIEPNEKFYSFLLKNYGYLSNIKIIKSICSSKEEYLKLTFNENNGTASLINVDSAPIIETTTIDLISSQIINKKQINFIKIDTDGYDFEVLKGAREAISINSPVCMFECDVFNNKNYVADINEALYFFHTRGYSYFLVYDNYGYLIGKHSTCDRKWFLQLIPYQCSSGIYYFDLLFINDNKITEFYKLELAHQSLITKSIPGRVAVESAGEILSANIV